MKKNLLICISFTLIFTMLFSQVLAFSSFSSRSNRYSGTTDDAENNTYFNSWGTSNWFEDEDEEENSGEKATQNTTRSSRKSTRGTTQNETKNNTDVVEPTIEPVDIPDEVTPTIDTNKSNTTQNTTSKRSSVSKNRNYTSSLSGLMGSTGSGSSGIGLSIISGLMGNTSSLSGLLGGNQNSSSSGLGLGIISGLMGNANLASSLSGLLGNQNSGNTGSGLEVITGLMGNADLMSSISNLFGNTTTSTDELGIADLANFIAKIMEIYSDVDTGAQKITTSRELAVLTSACAALEVDGPISITPAILTNNGVKTEVTLITLGGTEFKDGQATDIKTDILAGMELNNDFLNAIVELFMRTGKDAVIPTDKPVMIAGISLGGMAAQQLLAQEYITENYEIINIVTFGSPVICPNYRTANTKIVRLCDSSDLVPSLSVTEILGFDTASLDAVEKVVRDGGFKTTIGGHALSYVSADCWNNFDVLGVENGNAKLELTEAMTFYAAPLQ